MKTCTSRGWEWVAGLVLALLTGALPAGADVIEPEAEAVAPAVEQVAAPAMEVVTPVGGEAAAAAVAVAVRWEGDTVVYESRDWQLRIDYLNKGTRSEGQAGSLINQGQAVPPEAPGAEKTTPVGVLKHYGDERPQAWSVSGWNFADRKQIKRSEEVVPTTAPAEAPAPEAVTVTPDGPEAAVEIASGQVLRILLREQAGTGFHWKLESETRAAVLRFDGKGPPETRGEGGALGAPAMVPFTFTAVASGQAELRFVYRRPFEPDRAPEKETVVRVTVP